MFNSSNEDIYEHPQKMRGMGIRWSLFAFLAFFVAFVLLVVWVFNVLLLDSFYEGAKIKELKLTASVIEANINSDALPSKIYSLAGDYSTCIILYQIKGHMGEEPIKSQDVSRGCIIHNADGSKFSDLYAKAKRRDGEYTEYYSLDGFVQHKENATETGGTIYTKIFYTDDGREFVIFLDSKLAPVNAVLKTYLTQFRWISLVLLAGALILSMLMSKVISTPIIKLNRSVKRLAAGDYDEVFDGKGYREIRELSDALNYASSELSKNDRLQKELIANISHDLRTPLTMIRGYSEMMRDIPGENTPENAQVVIDETTRLSELVGDMLDLSKIRSGARKLTPEIFSLSETVRATMLRYEKLTEKDGYKIEFISNGDAPVNADRTMMLQVIYNLINNAVNYTGDDKRVTVCITQKEDKACFSVTDTGKGIPPKEIPLIWDRYYKVDKIHRRATVGTGIGLSIVKAILEEHKAVYGVKSTVGVGSTFWFELPIVKNQSK